MTRAALVPLWAAHLGLDARATSLIVGVAGAVELLLVYPAARSWTAGAGRRSLCRPWSVWRPGWRCCPWPLAPCRMAAGSAVATLGASALVVAGLAGLGAGWLARALDPRSQPERRAAS